VILFTGDLVNTKANEIDRFASILKTLKAKDGVYSVMGNHDYGDYVYWKSKSDHDANLQSVYDKQAQMGWKVLRNESIYLKRNKDSIALIGVENWGEPPFHQYGDLEKAMKNVDKNSFKLLLSHNPEHWRQVVVPNYNIDLTLAGHTHAWQMAFGWGKYRYSPAVFKYKNWGGLYSNGDKHIYVNEGTGYVLYPMRFGAGPEISIIRLKRK
jgi:predicted MPP superfamily phosphohydrolase